SLTTPGPINPVLRQDSPATDVTAFDPRLEPTPKDTTGQTLSPARPPAAVVGEQGSHVQGPGTRGVGRTLALAVPARARSVVFLLDRSASMGLHGAWDAARRASLEAIGSLPAVATFQVIPYNRQAEPLVLLGRRELMRAVPEALDEAARALAWLQ